MNVFIINLKKDIEKKMYMKEQALKYGLDVEFIEAVDGKNLSENNISKVYSKQASLQYFSRELTKGEIGTALSHISIYKRIIQKDIQLALVLEDDVDFNFTKQDLFELIANLPQDWECVLLGHHTKRSRDIDTLPSFWDNKKVTNDFECNRLAEEAFGAYGYLINKKGALRSVQRFRIIDRPIDHWNDNFLNLYAIFPSIIKVNHDFIDNSSLECERKVADSKIHRTLFQKIKDFIRDVLDKFHLNRIYYLIRDFFVQFRPLKRYMNE